MRPPRVFSSRRLTRFPTRSNRACTLGLVAKCVVEAAEGVVAAAGGRGLLPVAALSDVRAAAGILRREVPAAVGADGANKLVICDGGDGGRGAAGVQQVGVLRHLAGVVEVFGHDVVSHVGGQAQEEHRHEGRLLRVVLRQQCEHAASIPTASCLRAREA
jgi:hypothetical protein